MRFRRQIMIPQIGDEGQEKLGRAKVTVVGTGGLGKSDRAQQGLIGVGGVDQCPCEAVVLDRLA